MAAIVVIDQLAQPYDGMSMLEEPLGGSQSAVMDTCLRLSEIVETVLFNAVSSPRTHGRLRIRPNRQIVLSELADALWIVFVSWTTPTGLERLPLRKGGPKIALWAHHDVDQQAVRFLEEPSARRYISRYLFVSRWQRDRYIERFRIDPGAAAVIGNPYCERALSAVGQGEKSFDRPRLIYTSTPFRGLGILADAFPLFRRRFPDATLTVLSGMELYGLRDNTPYEDLFARIGRTPGITLLPPAGKIDLYRRLGEANLFAFPSTFAETFGIAALEARLLGNPLLLTRLGALPEIYPDARFFDGDAARDLTAERWAEFMAEAWEKIREERAQTALAICRDDTMRLYAPAAVAERLAAALGTPAVPPRGGTSGGAGRAGEPGPVEGISAQVPLYVGLTTLPSRIHHLRPTLDSLRNQTFPPDAILLCLPRRSIREDCAYDRPGWLQEYAPLLRIVDCEEDHGPGTKLLGCLDHLPEQGCLVLVDDDLVYRPFLLDCLYRRQVADPRSSFSFWTYSFEGIDVGQGADGFSFHVPNLAGIREFAERAVRHPQLRFADDLWISAFLKRAGISVRSLRHELPDDEDVYETVHRVNQLRDMEGVHARQAVLVEGARYLFESGMMAPENRR